MNAINVIKPYVWEGLWVFDDPEKQLLREPFVAGADVIMDVATANIPDSQQGFLLTFSGKPFPGYNIELDWVAKMNNGNVYRWVEKGMEGWLCPALLKYFDLPPAKIYISVGPCQKRPS